MARIVIVTYDHSIDRRALLQCKSLIAHGHEVELFALESESSVSDEPFVTRLGTNTTTAPTEMEAGEPAPLPHTIYHRANRAMPILFPIIKPIIRPVFWAEYGLFRPNQTPMVFRLRDLLNRTMPTWFNAMKPLLRSLYWRMYRHNPAALYAALYAPITEKIRAADVVIAHDLPMLPVAASIVEKTGGVLVYDSHELFCEQEYNDFEKVMWKRLEVEHISKAKKVITVNPTIARELEKRYSIPQVEVVLNAEWIQGETPIRERLFHTIFNLPEEAHIVLYQGGLSFGRNLDTLVKSMRYIANESVHMVILGSGPADSELHRIVAQHSLQDRVHFHPHVPQAELLKHTASADVGVIPYTDTCLNNRYCTPNKMFEFIAAGLPMIGTDLPEISRMCREHGIGISGDTSSPETLAALIEKVLIPSTNKKLREQVAAARQHINWQHEGEKFVAIIESALAA